MRILAALALLPVLPAMAAETTASMSSAGMGAQLSKLLLGLLLVIGLIFLLAWLLRRVQQLNPRGAQVIKIISTQALGPRDRLVLVQVGSEQILLGLSAGRITPLHVLEEPVHLPDAEPATPEFAQRLMELLGKDQKDKH
ncbi:flagellar biosynthetic protein FliO [Stutzerimonas nitrititolerans]|uniref:flagellar biosynthetic protein FliO n=1 Tax=Stutzerimonas nitrititolerans TaxID=2482751 RepID=UPI00289BCB9F|nr:flagellar biosynthetic protein FliO [Stutzerimonas nitrititolerans]